MKQHNTKTATVLMGLLAMGSAHATTVEDILKQDPKQIFDKKDILQDAINNAQAQTKTENDNTAQNVENTLNAQRAKLDEFKTTRLNSTFKTNLNHDSNELTYDNLQTLAAVSQETANKLADTNANLAKLAIKNAEATVKADEAQTTANNAQNTANNAQTAANNAETTANNAQTTAQNAENKATQAEQLAQNANNQIAGLQNVANNAQDTADTALSETRRLERNKANRTEVIALQDEVRSWEKVVIQHDNQIQVLNQQVSTHSKQIERLNQRIEDLSKETQDGLAAQAALTGLFQPYNVGKLNVSAALGGYKSRTALAVGVGYRVNERVAIKAGLASNTRSGDLAYNIGVNVEF